METTQKAVRVRHRLAQITKWVGPTSKPAISVACAIVTVINTLVVDNEPSEFSWFLNVAVGKTDPKVHTTGSQTNQKIEFKVQRPTKQGEWIADATEIEAALSLWIYHIRERETSHLRQEDDQHITRGGGKSSDWVQRDVLLVRKSTRLLDATTPSLERDLN